MGDIETLICVCLCILLINGLYIDIDADTNGCECDTVIYGIFCDPFFEHRADCVQPSDVISQNTFVILRYNNTQVAGRLIKLVDHAYGGIYSVELCNGSSVAINSMWIEDTGVQFGMLYGIERETSMLDGDVRTQYTMYNTTTGERVYCFMSPDHIDEPDIDTPYIFHTTGIITGSVGEVVVNENKTEFMLLVRTENTTKHVNGYIW